MARIVVLGTGDMGGAFAEALARRTRHAVRVRGSRPGTPSARALVDAHPDRLAEASDADVAAAEFVLVVVPWEALPHLAPALRDVTAVIVSVVVPWTADGDPRTKLESAAERIARLAPRARVVNAFTSVPSARVREPGTPNEVTVFACGDDGDAVARAIGLASELGFDAVHAGGLDAARYAEGLGLLWASLVDDGGFDESVSFKLVR